MSPTLNFKIDDKLTGYNNQQQITGLRTVYNNITTFNKLTWSMHLL